MTGNVDNDWWETKSCPGMLDCTNDHVGCYDDSLDEFNIRTPSEYPYNRLTELNISISQFVHDDDALINTTIDIADEFNLQTPDEVFLPTPYTTYTDKMLVSLNEMCLADAVHQKRQDFMPELYGFKFGQQVYWSHKDAAFGASGVVTAASHHYDDLCLLVRFKGCEYHCYTSHITPHNPKSTKLDRREYMTTVGPQNAHRAKCNDNSHRTGTLLDPDILYNQTASSEADNHFTTSVSTHDQPEVCQPPHIKGRAYGRKQRLNRIRRRVYRRELHQKKNGSQTHNPMWQSTVPKSMQQCSIWVSSRGC
jgi:hypothetical protein